MQTIVFTKRSTMNKLHQWRDEMNRIGRGVGTFLATPGTVIEYPSYARITDSTEDVLLLRRPTGPHVGQGATVGIGSDRYAATVIAVSPSGHKVTVQYDKATRTDNRGLDEWQEYTYEADPHGTIQVFYRNQRGHYRASSYRLSLGVRSAYLDPSF